MESNKANINTAPKILLISNNPISNSTNNGRTIFNFLKSFGNENIINLYFDSSLPSSKEAKSYYRISNKDVLRFGFMKRVGTIVNPSPNSVSFVIKREIKKSSWKLLVREFVWGVSNWNNKKLHLWISNFNPNCIVLQIGDAPFAIKIAKRLSNKLKLPVFIYNSENYYFKNFDYFNNSLKPSFAYKIFHNRLKKAYRSINKGSTWFHLTDSLMNKYRGAFPDSNHYISRNTSEVKRIEYHPDNGRFNMFYFGNLRTGRFETLKNVYESACLNNNEVKLYIYSNLSQDRINKLNEYDGIIYKGFKPFEEILNDISNNCDLLLHIEPFDDFSKVDLIDGFSTKIVDCLSSGVPFLVYAPDSLNLFKYLKSNDACFLASDKNSLSIIINKLLDNANYRSIKLENALKLIKSNHSELNNSEQVKKIFISCLNK